MITNLNYTSCIREYSSLICFAVITIFVFLILLPISLQVKFIQNDEWVHYLTIQNFLNGNFKLHEYIGSTFYVMGYLSYVYSLIFSVSSLPLLTLFISSINLVLLFYIFKYDLGLKFKFASYLAFIYFFNPINFYSIFGFMIEEYFLFFLLLSFIFINKFIREKNSRSLTYCLIFLTLGFFVKQLMVFIIISFLLYLYINYRKFSYILALYLISLMIIYVFVFPRTEIMKNQDFDFINILNIKYLIMIGIYVCALFLPDIVVFIRNYYKFIEIKYFIPLLISLYIVFNYVDLSLKFPYFQNVFTRQGFFRSDLIGDKYSFIGNYKLFEGWQVISYILLSIIAIIVFKLLKSKFKQIKNFYYLTSIVYLLFLISNTPLYDRYLIILFVVLLIAAGPYLVIENNKVIRTLRVSFLSLLIVLDMYYIYDFLWWQNIVWSEARRYIASEKLNPRDVSATRSWNKLNNVVVLDEENKKSDNNMKYFFSFDSPEKFDYPNYKLYKEYSRDLELDIFVKPRVFLYKKIDN